MTQQKANKQTVRVNYDSRLDGDHAGIYGSLHEAEEDARKHLESGAAIRRVVILENGVVKQVLTAKVAVEFRITEKERAP